MDPPYEPGNVDKPTTERVPPRERFAHDAVQFDLHSAALQLESEHDEGQHGHRQVALYKHEKTTIALFRFEKGGGLPDHRAQGTVIIQVIEGNIALEVAGEEHSLKSGGLMVLAPGVKHDVKAFENTLMLLTVCLDGSRISAVQKEEITP